MYLQIKYSQIINIVVHMYINVAPLFTYTSVIRLSKPCIDYSVVNTSANASTFLFVYNIHYSKNIKHLHSW